MLHYIYDELKQLTDTLYSSQPSWFTSRYAAPIDKASLLETTARPGSSLGS